MEKLDETVQEQIDLSVGLQNSFNEGQTIAD
jgi:hypothetical protein